MLDCYGLRRSRVLRTSQSTSHPYLLHSQVGQKPITYYRQVLSLCDLPAEFGVDHPKVYELFPADVVERAREYREIIGPSGTGAYTHSVSDNLVVLYS